MKAWRTGIINILLWLTVIIIVAFCGCNLNYRNNPDTTEKQPSSDVSRKPMEVSCFIRDLKHEDPRIRWNGAANLGAMKDKSALKPLAHAASDENWQVRLLSIWALGRIGDREAFPQLAQGLRDSHMDVRLYSIWALGEIGDKRGIEVLRKVLDTDEETGNREAIIQALSKIDGPGVFGILVGLLEDTDENVRAEAARALGFQKNKEALPYLAKKLRDENEQVVLNSIFAIRLIGARDYRAPLEEMKNHRAQRIRFEARKTLEALDTGKTHHEEYISPVEKRDRELYSQCPPALELDDLSGKNPGDTKSPAYMPMKLGGKLHRDSIIEDLKSESPDIRGEAAWQLGNRKDLDSVPLLIELLKDKDCNVRWHAAKALGKSGDRRALDPLTGMLDDPDKDVREDVVEALWKLGFKEAVNPLGNVLTGDDEPYIRARAALALGYLGDGRGFDYLRESCNDENPQVRASCALALGRLGDKRGIELLNKMKLDSSIMVKRTARASLEVLEESGNPHDLKEDEYIDGR